MNCYYHQDIAAVGICKSCMRGLCTECASDVSQGLACRGRCEADAEEIIEVVRYNIRVRKAAPGHLGRQRAAVLVAAVFATVMGAFFVWVGFSAPDAIWVPIVLGSLIAAYGCFLLFRAVKFRVPQ